MRKICCNMKYLKRFNENVSSEFRQLCEESLINLTDKNFKISYKEGIIKIEKWDNYGRFHWNECKDNILPFYEILKDQFSNVNIIAKIGWTKIKYGTQNSWVAVDSEFLGNFEFPSSYNPDEEKLWKSFNNNIDLFDEFMSDYQYSICFDFYIVYN